MIVTDKNSKDSRPVWYTKGLSDSGVYGLIHLTSDGGYSTDCGIDITTTGRWYIGLNELSTCTKCKK